MAFPQCANRTQFASCARRRWVANALPAPEGLDSRAPREAQLSDAEPSSAAQVWWRHDHVVWGALVLLIACVLPEAIERTQSGNDFGAYRAGAVAIVEGRDPGEAQSAGGMDYLYLPFLAAVLAPFAALSESTGGAIWLGLNLLCIVAICFLLRRFPPWADGRVSGRAIALGALVVWAPLGRELAFGQADLLVLLACLAAFHAHHRNRPTRAGLALALAIAIKVTPAFLGLWFLLRGAHKTLLVCAASFVVAVVLVPAFFLGFSGSLHANGAWAERVAAPFLAQGEAADDETGEPPTIRYGTGYSLSGTMRRALTDAPVDQDGPDRGNLADLPVSLVSGLYYALALALVAACVLLVRRGGARAGHALGQPAFFLLVMVVIAPLSHRANFLVAWPAAAWLLARPSRGAYLAAGASALLFTAPEVLPTRAAAAVLAYGGYVIAALLLAALLWARLTPTRAAPAASSH